MSAPLPGTDRVVAARVPAPRTPTAGSLAVVRDVDLAGPVVDQQVGPGPLQAWVLLRVLGEPVGLVTVDVRDGVLHAADVLGAAVAEAGSTVADRVREAGGDPAAALAGRGAGPVGRPAFLARHERLHVPGVLVTVVVCTRERPDGLRLALESLQDSSFGAFEVLVVDNAPSTTATLEVVEELRVAGGLGRGLQYTVEPRPGLSWARNRALGRVRTRYVAWLDDDETADRHWLAEIVAAFADHPEAAAVTGCVVPAELRTRAQLWFEAFGGHTKGRGFRPQVFTARGPQHPMFPLPPFGAGANMAFDVARLRAVGGFDVALGAGTATCGGEDTLALTEVLLAGGSVVYRPTAVTRHRHRADLPALERQMRGYGVGLTAYYTALVLRDPRRLPALLRLVPRAVAHLLGAGADLPADFPADLLRLKTRAMLDGPRAYLAARLEARRLRTARTVRTVRT